MDTNENKPNSGVATRREFIKKTTTLAAAAAATNMLTGCLTTPVYGQSQAPSTGRTIGANDRISVGVIGVGVGIGQNHLEHIQKNGDQNNVVVSCASDLFNKRRDIAKDKAGLKDADVYIEYRKILDRKDVDAVVIATHDPWHAQISMDAIQAGKHVYCEKPMTRYLGDAFKVYDTVKKAPKLTFQIGSQGTSAGGWKKCADLIAEGKLGQLVWAQGFYCRNSVNGEWNDPPFNIDKDSSAQSIDWDTWQAPVEKKVPFSAERFHRWRKFYPYCAGVLGDLAPHRMHPLMLAAGAEFPVRVTSIGTHNVHADKNMPGAEEREVPEHQQLLAEFPSGALITLTCSTVNARSPGFVLYCHKATLNVAENGAKVDVLPESPFSEDIDPATYDGMQAEDIRTHEKNFFDAIRGVVPAPNGNVELAIRVQTVLSLAEMSNRLNTMCLFDEKTRTITDGSGKKIDAISAST
jgi:predicted dehydrogenase